MGKLESCFFAKSEELILYRYFIPDKGETSAVDPLPPYGCIGGRNPTFFPPTKFSPLISSIG